LGEDATRFGLGGLFSFSSNVLAAQLRDDAVWQIGKRLTLTALLGSQHRRRPARCAGICNGLRFGEARS